MSTRLALHLTLCLAVAAMIGCAPIETPRGQSLLKPPRMSTDSVVLDIFFVRCPLGDPEANEALWRQIDEQQLPADSRRRLLENGFRVGVLAGPLPEELSRLMELADKPAPSGEPTQVALADLADKPHVERRHLQIRAGARGEIITANVQDELPVLLRDASGRISGQSYAQAQPLLSITPFLEPDGRVRIELVPEVQYGPIRQHHVVDDTEGALRFEPSRDRCVLDAMTVNAVLSAGDMLILSSLPHRPGSLGDHFLTESDRGATRQKLLLIRLSQTQHDDQFEKE